MHASKTHKSQLSIPKLKTKPYQIYFNIHRASTYHINHVQGSGLQGIDLQFILPLNHKHEKSPYALFELPIDLVHKLTFKTYEYLLSYQLKL